MLNQPLLLPELAGNLESASCSCAICFSQLRSASCHVRVVTASRLHLTLVCLQSRNRTVGIRLGKGEKLEDITATMGVSCWPHLGMVSTGG